MRARRRAHACLVALSLVLACDAESDEWEVDDDAQAFRGGETPTSVRVVTANLAHVSWCEMLRRNGLVTAATCAEDAIDLEGFQGIAQLLAWWQVEYLETLQASGPTIFNTQEASVRLPRTARALWPAVLALSLGGNAYEPEYAVYEACYDPINPPDGSLDGSNGDPLDPQCRATPPGEGGSWGNAITTNLDVEEYRVWSLDHECEGDGVERRAHAARVRVEGVDVWSVNVHLEFCRQHGDFSVNACNLENLFERLDTLPSDDVVIVSGDFNISQDATPGDQWCPGAIHPNRFMEMLDGFRDRLFIHVGSARVDHVFLRDPHFELSGEDTQALGRFHDIGDETYEMSDHDILETEIEVGGEGMSPAFLPLYVTLN